MNECDPQVWVSQMLFRSSILVPSMRNLSSTQRSILLGFYPVSIPY